MEIITLYIHQLKKDALMELLHTLLERADQCPTIVQNMSQWYGPLKESFAELNRLYQISLKSTLTEEITLNDGQRDGIITGMRAIGNSYLKDEDSEKREAARVIMTGLTSGIKLNIQDQYIEQTGQIDNLLNFLLVLHRDATEKLGLLGLAGELKRVNDRMHELIEGRIAEREDKVFGAFEFARTQTETCYRDWVKFVNAWALVNNDRLESDARDLAQFVSWYNAYIEVFKQKVMHIPVNTPAAGDADKDPDDPETPPTVEDPDGEPNEGEQTEGNENEGKKKIEYVYNGNIVATQWYNVGDRVVEPEGLLPDGWIWGNTPNVMPDRDITVTAVEDE